MKTNSGNFFQACYTAQKGVEEPHSFFIQNYYKKTVGNFCMISFASSRQWSKLILGILSSMQDHLKGCDMAMLIFGYKILEGK